MLQQDACNVGTLLQQIPSALVLDSGNPMLAPWSWPWSFWKSGPWAVVLEETLVPE